MAKGGQRVRIFSALEAANICGVVNQTAINWIRNGYLKAFTTPGGQYRIYAKDLAAFLDKRGMSASGEVLEVILKNAGFNIFLIIAEQPVNDRIKAELNVAFPGNEIVQAYDWFEAGRKIVAAKPGFVLLDAELPGVDILRFLYTVKEDSALKHPHITLITNNTSRFEDTRADAVMEKPLDISELEKIIRNHDRPLDETAVTA